VRVFATALFGAVFIGAALTAASAAGKPQVASIGDKIQSQQAQIEATRKRLDEKRHLLQFQELRAGDLHRQLEETNSSIARVGSMLEQISGEVKQNQRNATWNELQLDAARTTLARHTAALERRLVDAYEHGDLGYVNVLLSASSFTDFVERLDDIRYLIAQNETTVRERKAAEARVLAAEEALESERAVLTDSLSREQQTRYKLAALADQRVQLVALADQQRLSVAHEVAQLEDLSAAQESALEALIRERQAAEAARRAAENNARRRAAQLAGVELPPPVSDGAPSSFGWPVSGPITSPFGMRTDPLGRGFRMHTGIDIGAPMGSTVTASAGGRIIYAGWEGGYGNTIIIDHGGATSTLYAHLSQIFISQGQDVQRGQAIGAVGCTGNCTGPHLHFEIRLNGVPTDPTARLR
jgi:murein DD-endopeptidase MepM/ murein hydrolase activator NlpD